MGHQTLVYGVIEVPSTPLQVARAAAASNFSVLSALPSTDEWPFIVKPMFANTQSGEVNVEYMYSPIHFAASYKEVDADWAAWVTKFEQLLFKLCGAAAVVHVESERFPSRKLEWVATSSPSPSRTETQWQFVSGPRTSAELNAV